MRGPIFAEKIFKRARDGSRRLVWASIWGVIMNPVGGRRIPREKHGSITADHEVIN
jgi:hypothetical protein